MAQLRKGRLDMQPTSAGPAAAPPPPVPAILQAPVPQGSRVLVGTSANKKNPRILDLVVKETEFSLFMHPPGSRTVGPYMTASFDETRRRWAAGERTLAQVGNKRFEVKLPADDPEVPTGQIRIQLGTPDGQWWMYVDHNDFNEAMQAVGPQLC
jgi:hypothetical protein